MDHTLTKPFTYVHQNVGDNKMSDKMIDCLHILCGVSVYEQTVTITCDKLSEIGRLAHRCTEQTNEGPSMQFFGKIGRELVKFIGG